MTHPGPTAPARGTDDALVLGRRHAWLFLGIAAWNAVSYANFARNLLEAWQGGEDRPTGYWVAHVVLIVVNTVIAVVLARLGWRVWRRTRRG